jgi:hypothetical protein
MREIEIVATKGSEKEGNVEKFPGMCVQYDSLKEADQHLGKDSGGGSIALALLNLQVKTSALNKLRVANSAPSMNKQLLTWRKEDPKKYVAAIEAMVGAGLMEESFLVEARKLIKS